MSSVEIPRRQFLVWAAASSAQLLLGCRAPAPKPAESLHSYTKDKPSFEVDDNFMTTKFFFPISVDEPSTGALLIDFKPQKLTGLKKDDACGKPVCNTFLYRSVIDGTQAPILEIKGSIGHRENDDRRADWNPRVKIEDYQKSHQFLVAWRGWQVETMMWDQKIINQTPNLNIKST